MLINILRWQKTGTFQMFFVETCFVRKGETVKTCSLLLYMSLSQDQNLLMCFCLSKVKNEKNNNNNLSALTLQRRPPVDTKKGKLNLVSISFIHLK